MALSLCRSTPSLINLGVTFSQDLKWAQHTLIYIWENEQSFEPVLEKLNLRNCPWFPQRWSTIVKRGQYIKKKLTSPERAQRKAASFCTKNHHAEVSVVGTILGYPRQPSPRASLHGRASFSLISLNTSSKALFIWSLVPETTLPPSYPGRANFSLISLKNSTNCLHENANSSRGGGGGGGGGGGELGWASCLASAGRVTLSGGATFTHINTLARLPEARWLKLFPKPATLSNM